jgi:hypothetical protein
VVARLIGLAGLVMLLGLVGCAAEEAGPTAEQMKASQQEAQATANSAWTPEQVEKFSQAKQQANSDK